MIPCMIRILAFTFCLAGSAASAQDAEREFEEGFNLFAEGARLLMEQLMTEMLPVMRDLRGLVDDIGNYQAPELLPNGDIIIRRKPEALEPPGEGEVDL